MKTLFASILVGALCATPALADPGRGPGHGKGHGHHAHHGAHCPPGLAKKNPSCTPPGHARKKAHHLHRVGDTLRGGDYILVRDPGRYALDARPDWRYYRDNDRIYRVDSDTRKILAVLNLIDAFTN